VKTVLLTDSIASAGEELLSRSATVIRAPDSAPATIRTFARDADGVITRSKLPDDILDAAPRLRAVVIHGTGTDLVTLEKATARWQC
jgi:D-3-phosphoglycerate dehydrogenase